MTYEYEYFLTAAFTDTRIKCFFCGSCWMKYRNRISGSSVCRFFLAGCIPQPNQSSIFLISCSLFIFRIRKNENTTYKMHAGNESLIHSECIMKKIHETTIRAAPMITIRIIASISESFSFPCFSFVPLYISAPFLCMELKYVALTTKV